LFLALGKNLEIAGAFEGGISGNYFVATISFKPIQAPKPEGGFFPNEIGFPIHDPGVNLTRNA
jgi:hypothetical protein